jgi:hypothetical protein
MSISQGTFSGWKVVGLFIWILNVAILLYDTECLLAGNCYVWSWIRTVLYSIIPTIVIVLVVLSLGKKDDTNEQAVPSKKA